MTDIKEPKTMSYYKDALEKQIIEHNITKIKLNESQQLLYVRQNEMEKKICEKQRRIQELLLQLNNKSSSKELIISDNYQNNLEDRIMEHNETERKLRETERKLRETEKELDDSIIEHNKTERERRKYGEMIEKLLTELTTERAITKRYEKIIKQNTNVESLTKIKSLEDENTSLKERNEILQKKLDAIRGCL